MSTLDLQGAVRCARCGAVRSVRCFVSRGARGACGAVFRDAPGQRTARGARGVCGAVFRDTVAIHSEWQWYELGHMQICTSPEHPTTQFFTGRMPFLPPNQQRQALEATDRQTDRSLYYSYVHN